jgi:hypothetical protein
MRRGLLALLVLLALVLAPTAAFAQDEPVELPVACGNLPDEDCDFLRESARAMQELTSYAASLDMGMSLLNVPGLPSDLSISLGTNGAFSMNPELTARMVALQAASQTDSMAALQEMMDLVVDLYNEIAFDLVFDLGISRDIESLLSQSAGMPVPGDVTVPMRMADGFLYINLEDIGGEVAGMEGVGWIGIDYGTLMSDAVNQAVTQLEAGGAMDPTSMSMAGSLNLSLNRDLQDAVNAYTDAERLDDTTVDGVDAAQFRWDFDLAGFVTDPAFLDMMVQQIEMQLAMQEAMGQEAPPLTDADIQMVTDMLPMLAPMLLSGLQFETVSNIGLDDGYVYSTETHVEWDMSTVIQMAAMAQGQQVQRGAEAPVFTFHVRSENSGFNEPFEIEVPEDAIIIPLDQLQAGDSM